MLAIADNNANLGTDGDDVGNDRLAIIITNPDVEVTLPVLKYGYRTTKAAWEELVQIIDIEGDIPKLSRSRAQQRDYEVFRCHMKKQYLSTLDYILISKFDFDAIAVSSSSSNGNCNSSSLEKRKQKWMAGESLEDVKTPKIILVENDFPYYVEDNIVHYVLWKLKEPIVPQDILKAREELQSEKINALEILQWVNPPNLKSIPEIDHVHFLCRLK